MNEINSLSDFNKFVSKLEPMEIGMFGGRRFKERGNSTIDYSLKELVNKMQTLIGNQEPDNIIETYSTLETLKKLDKDATIKVNNLHGIDGRIKQIMTSIKQLFFGFDHSEFEKMVTSYIRTSINLKDIDSLLDQQYFIGDARQLYLNSGGYERFPDFLRPALLIDACKLLPADKKSNLKLILDVFITLDDLSQVTGDQKLAEELAAAKRRVLTHIAGERSFADNMREVNVAFRLLLQDPSKFLDPA